MEFSKKRQIQKSMFKLFILSISFFMGVLFVPECAIADLATPFVESNNQIRDISEAHGWVVTLGSELENSKYFYVIVNTDTMDQVVIGATAEKGVVKESMLGRWVIIKAQVTSLSDVPRLTHANIQLKILSLKPVEEKESDSSKKQSIEVDGWTTRFNGKTGIISDDPEGSVLVGGPKEINGLTSIQINDTYYKNTKCRIIAIDNDGKIHISYQKSNLDSEKQYRTTDAIFPGLKLEQVKEFQFQTRPIVIHKNE